jgi:CRP/FNR family cyclic AMP-dependent transcriptional regulator
MAIATATLNYDPFSRSVKVPSSTDGPALEALRACPQLRGATTEALRIVARQSTLRPVSRGTILAAQGSRIDFAMLLIRGKLRSVCRSENGREISVEVFRGAELIADSVIAPDAPLGNDWETVEAGVMLVIPRDVLLGCVRTSPEIALAMAAALVVRLERSKQLATGLALSDVQDRVVSRLVALGRQDGTPGPEGLLIRNRPTQQELANQIGACRETVSRTVSELVRRGMLTPRGRSLLVSNQLLLAT